MSTGAYDQPTSVEAVDSEVTLDGPDGVGLSMESNDVQAAE